MNDLLMRLEAHGLIDPNGNIVLEQYSGGGYQGVDVELFQSVFGSVLDSVSEEERYDSLVAADAGRGYARFFIVWRDAGIL